MTYHADGHRLMLRVEQGGIAVEVECPGPERCEGQMEGGGCIVQFNARELGAAEFGEAQERLEDGYRDSDTPCEIEWREWGTSGTYFDDPEYEFWWRPV